MSAGAWAFFSVLERGVETSSPVSSSAALPTRRARLRNRARRLAHGVGNRVAACLEATAAPVDITDAVRAEGIYRQPLQWYDIAFGPF